VIRPGAVTQLHRGLLSSGVVCVRLSAHPVSKVES